MPTLVVTSRPDRSANSRSRAELVIAALENEIRAARGWAAWIVLSNVFNERKQCVQPPVTVNQCSSNYRMYTILVQ